MEREWYGYLDKKKIIVRREKGRLANGELRGESASRKGSRLWLGRKGQASRDWLLYLDNRIVRMKGDWCRIRRL